MFDLAFSELLMIGLVALVVLGPERLPKAARFAGLWVRRARAQWYSVKSELEREMAAEELKQNLDAVRTAATDLDREVREAAGRVETGVRDAGAHARREVKELGDRFEGVTGDGSATSAADPAAPEAPGNATVPPRPDVSADGTAPSTPPIPSGDADDRR
ncbi:Sec-independent protein translocase protein TatB [Luteimonas granuli]|uniref:Sec-independent protein translocase protein TatB n=1 Tax=Luteimonas granuli TaxID=1176533 RepID=A0A518N4H6_9GAMM|nr:Sec-independent protein translocase protein TatB [Luteimonas granuli]QDW66822.1 twin-arginine translocase subunit TatB [Luteimonas granuli]